MKFANIEALILIDSYTTEQVITVSSPTIL